MKLPKDDSGEIIPLYQSEVQQIDKLFNLKTEFGLRNWCIVHLMLDAGLRSSEVINLRFCDLMLPPAESKPDEVLCDPSQVYSSLSYFLCVFTDETAGSN